MGIFKVVIIDDDELSIETLLFELKKDERFLVEGVARNGRQGRKLVEKVQPDLLFLDVEMPYMTGMDLLQELRDIVTWNMRTVFYTAYDNYMIHAIREAAFDYLLKPFTDQDLKEILTRFVEQAEMPRPIFSQMPKMAAPGQQTLIVFTPTNDMRALHMSEIGYFRYNSEHKLWEVMLSNQPPISLRRGVTAEQIIAYSPALVQIHQSYIINMDYLMLIKESKCLLYPPFDQVTELLVSRKYKKELQVRFCL